MPYLLLQLRWKFTAWHVTTDYLIPHLFFSYLFMFTFHPILGGGAQEAHWSTCLHRMQFENAAGSCSYFLNKFVHSFLWVRNFFLISWLVLYVQNVKAVFDAAIRVVLQPPKQKKKKSKAQKACSILWLEIGVKKTTTLHSACNLPPFPCPRLPFSPEEVGVPEIYCLTF